MFHRLHLTFVHVDLPVIFFFVTGYYQVLRIALRVRAVRMAQAVLETAPRVHVGSA